MCFKLVGMNNIISNNDFDVVWRKGLRFVEENSVDEAMYSNASAFYGGEHVVVDASKVGEKVEKVCIRRICRRLDREQTRAFSSL